MGRHNARRYLLLAAAGIVLGGGCALTDVNLKPTYATTTQRCVRGDHPLVLDRLVDERRRVGMKKNAYGWESASVYLGDAAGPMKWLRGALVTELEAAGYRVEQRRPTPTDPLALNVRVEQLYVEPLMGFTEVRIVGQALIEGQLRLDGNRWLARRIKGQSRDSGIFVLQTQGTYEALLLSASQKALSKLSASICDMTAAQP